MKYASLVLTVLCSSLALASTKTDFHPLVSQDSKSCYNDALLDARHSDYQPALAKLESLIMVGAVAIGIDKSELPSDAKGYDDSVEKGVGIWQSAIPDCPYRMVHGSSEHPQVVVKFVKSIENHGGDLQGMIHAQHDFKWNGSQHVSKLTCTVYVVYRTGGRNLSHSEVTEVVAHELGHLLGLTDNSEPVGMMGPFVAGEPRLTPSSDEVEAVKQFRQTVRSAIDKIEDQL